MDFLAIKMTWGLTMYIRFVVQTIDPQSQKRQGLFCALSRLYYAQKLWPYELSLYEDLWTWFDENLERPHSFSRSSKPDAKEVALSWFKDDAREHIDKMRNLAELLRAHGLAAEMIRTDRPGYIVYEDEYQIAAVPFHETGA